MQRPALQRVLCLLSAISLLRLAASVPDGEVRYERKKRPVTTVPTALKSIEKYASEHGGRTCARTSATLAKIFARRSMDEKLFIKARPDKSKNPS